MRNFFLILVFFSVQGLSEDLPRYSLEEALQRSLDVSRKVFQAQTDLQIQSAKKHQASADVGPRLKADYNSVFFDDVQSFQMAPGQKLTLRPKEMKSGSLTLIQPITPLFALVENVAFETLQEEIKDAALSLTKADTAFQVVESYRRSQLTSELVKIAQASVHASESQRHDGQALERAGKLTRGDMLKIELAVSDANLQFSNAQVQAQITLQVLKEMLDVKELEKFQLDPIPSSASVLAKKVPCFEEAEKLALVSRLEIKQAEKGVQAGEFGKELAMSRFIPVLNFFIKWERNFDPSATTPGFGEPKEVRSLGLQATWDIWDNGSRVFAYQQASLQETKTESQLTDLKSKIGLEIFQTLTQLNASRDTIKLAEQAVNQAEEAYRMEKLRFSQGSSTVTELLLSESAMNKARGRLVAAVIEFDLQSIRLQKTLGETFPKI